MENGTVLQPNDRYLLESENFRLYYTSASAEAHKFFAGAKRPKGRAHRGCGGLQRQQLDADVQLQQRDQEG